jgi:hypothetical protein
MSWRGWVKTYESTELTSVAPPDAPSKTISPAMRGKVPAYRKANGMWVGISDSLATRMMTVAEAKQASHDGATVGMLSRNYPGADNDINHPELARDVTAYLLKELGPAPVRSVEGSSHVLAMYAAGSTYLRKRRLAFRLPGDPEGAKPHAVELLGLGQFYCVEGMHKSGEPYRWSSPHPCELGPYNLTVITAEQVQAVIMEGIPKVFGITPLKGTGSSGNLTSGHRTKLGDPSKLAPSPQHVLALLAEYRPAELGHDEFVRHLAAIKGALGSDCEEYYPDVLEWAPGVRSTEDEATRKRWDSITETLVGWQWLVDKSGTGSQAQDDFDEAVPEDSYPADPAELALKNMVQGWIAHDGGFHEETTGRGVSKDFFNALHAHVVPYGLTGRKTAAALFQNDKRARKATTVAYRPGAPIFVKSDSMLNGWRPSSLDPVLGVEPTLWLRHWENMVPDEDARNRCFDFMAFIKQKPGSKIGHALVLYSDAQGIGKDTAFLPLLRGLGEGNYVKLTPQDLLSKYNAFLDHELILIPEMRNFEKGQMYLIIKNYIGIEEGAPQIEQKYEKLRAGYRFHNWIICTNYGNALGLDEEDRRFDVVRSLMVPQPDAYYNELWSYYDNGGDAVCVGWLMSRDISKFDPAARPPMTQAKRDMIDAAMSPANRWLKDQFGEGGLFHGRVLLTVGEIQDANEWGADHMHQGHVMTALRKYGYFTIGARTRIGGSLPVTVWTNDLRLTSLSGEFLAAAVLKDRKKN